MRCSPPPNRGRTDLGAVLGALRQSNKSTFQYLRTGRRLPFQLHSKLCRTATITTFANAAFARTPRWARAKRHRCAQKQRSISENKRRAKTFRRSFLQSKPPSRMASNSSFGTASMNPPTQVRRTETYSQGPCRPPDNVHGSWAEPAFLSGSAGSVLARQALRFSKEPKGPHSGTVYSWTSTPRYSLPRRHRMPRAWCSLGRPQQAPSGGDVCTRRAARTRGRTAGNASALAWIERSGSGQDLLKVTGSGSDSSRP
jgi:hypothetical protein